jgi:hypothetical protein
MGRGDPYWEAEGQPSDWDRIEDETGGWSWRLPDAFDPTVLVTGTYITWRYDGQERHDAKVEEPRTPVLVVGEEVQEVEFEDYLLGSVRIDAWGRRWVPDSIDFERMVEWTGELPRTRMMNDSGLEVGEEESFLQETWTTQRCGTDDLHVWNQDGRHMVTSPSLRHKAVVQLKLTYIGGGQGSCTGTLVRSDAVLTSAHCGFTNLSSMKVCRLDSSECRAVSQVQRNPAYTGTQYWEDWMVLELGGCTSGCNQTPQAGWNSSVEDMNAGSQSDAELQTIQKVNMSGVPGWTLTNAGWCDGSNISDPQKLYHNLEFTPLCCFNHPNQLRYEIDSSSGMSGSPLYSCPSDGNQECTSTEKGAIFAVHSGWLSGAEKHVGPKIPSSAHRPAILAFLND